MTRENLSTFENRVNVTKVTSDNGQVSYLTPTTAFTQKAYDLGASKVNTFENEKKHVLFFFNNSDAEVGRAYLGKRLHGKKPEELVAMKHSLLFFESWNPEKKAWIPCVGLGASEDLAAKAVAL